MSLLSPDQSILGGVTVAALVYGIYQSALPSIADARSAQAGNQDLQAAERTASFVTAGVVAGVSILAQDPTIFIMGGAMVIGMAWWHRHADMVRPELGKAVPHFSNPASQNDAEAIATAETPVDEYMTSA